MAHGGSNPPFRTKQISRYLDSLHSKNGPGNIQYMSCNEELLHVVVWNRQPGIGSGGTAGGVRFLEKWYDADVIDISISTC